MSTNKHAGMAGVLVLLGFPTLLILAILLNGWALSVIWGWFVVPVFAVKAITVWQAASITIVTSLLIPSPTPAPKEEFLESLCKAAFRPLIFVAVGWLVRTVA